MKDSVTLAAAGTLAVRMMNKTPTKVSQDLHVMLRY